MRVTVCETENVTGDHRLPTANTPKHHTPPTTNNQQHERRTNVTSKLVSGSVVKPKTHTITGSSLPHDASNANRRRHCVAGDARACNNNW